ncbi:hypothetical protein C7447_102512 [Tenacibaculum adriaticum]|uniref:DUF2971 family protein n=1 Tax=Tenacibaculum adriaticum TaxID=413713 RepID=A0A5S5DTH7_9FLAO|nr:DUF2971 domain-containing protein [Tenacibaculum adriaticum]TYP99191.1 hypothetical protein C7447_102512 [Tenacibaculum adriaticum]
MDKYNTFNGKAYRFLSFEGFYKTIENKSLRFTRIDGFNDPLDCSPFLHPEIEWNEVENNYGKQFPDLTVDFVKQKALGSLFVCCFSKEYDTDDSYLMWSHYANSHTQVCFEIDFSINHYLGGPSEVIYPNNLKEYSLNNAENIGLMIVTSKLKQWKYEKEVRLVIDINYRGVKDNIQFVKGDNKHLYSPIDLQLISKVIFGLKSNFENEKKIILMFLERGLQPTFEKMRISPIDLKLESIKYNIDKITSSSQKNSTRNSITIQDV